MKTSSPIVINLANKKIEVRFANQIGLAPTTFSNVIGRDTVQNEGSYSKNIYLGVATGTRSDLLTLEYPIQHGIVTDFEAMEQIFQHIFHQELCIDPEEYPVLLTEAPFNPEAKRNTMIKMLFEKFNIPQLRVEKAPILSLLDMRKKTGIVVDCGDDVTHVIPVYDGNILLKDCSSVNLGDRDVKNHLRSTLMKSNRGVDFKSDTLYHIQEKKCLVALDFEKEMASFHEQSWWRKRKISKENSYKLPDGKVITIGNESIRSTEVLFQPSLFGKRGFGITEALYDSIMNVDIRFRDTLSSNIFFIGPIIKYPGFAERIRKDIPSTTELSVRCLSESENSVWRGGSSLASSVIFEDLTIKKKEYESSGEHFLQSTVHKNSLKMFIERIPSFPTDSEREGCI
ncbi:actin-3-like [Artemia franciscana]|uniref:actin-3-like n=1 Tax=Artemia franciscana TaxID=6661 RepID=UPI0032DA9F6F